MTDTGLSDRLRQQSRRSGLMVGVSMALTIGICVGVFVASYARLGSLASDFVPQDATFVPTVVPATTQVAAVPAGNEPAPTPPPADAATDEGAPSGQGPVAPGATEPAFAATHQITPGSPINFRSSPGVAGDETIISVLDPGTPLRSLGEEQSVGGAVWMRFEIESGEQGWVREVDTEPVAGSP